MYSKIEIIILGLLSKKPSHGYGLNQQLKNLQIEKIIKISPISIYKGLERLATKGLIKPRSEKVGRMPERTVYQINKEGLEELKKQTHCLLANGFPVDFDIYAALLFIDCLDKKETISALKERKEILHQIISSLEKSYDQNELNQSLQYKSIYQHNTQYYATELDWTKKTMKKIQNVKNWPKKGGV